MNAPNCGLMTTDLPKRKSPKPVLNDTWRLLAREGLSADVSLVLFHPHEINLAKRTVNGYTWSPQTGWHAGTYPLPPVIVDNVMISFARRDKMYAANKRALGRLQVLVLNPRLPDKWGVWQALRASPLLAKHLPETALLQHSHDLENWLAEYRSVYVKPVRGSGGNGVLAIRQVEAGRYLLTGKNNSPLTRGDLHMLASQLLASQKEKHLLQRGLPLLEIDNRKIDVRVYLHRDGDRNWRAIATVPRLGPHGKAVTNLAQGGQVRSLDWLAELAEEYNFDLPDQEDIEQVAIAGAEAVTRIRPTLAFLGIDLALDPAGGIWVLDINPRPGRKVLTPSDRQRAFQYLIAYVKSLL